MRRLSLAGRKELARLIFCFVAMVGIVQSVLLADGVGASAPIRYGLGIPLTVVALVVGACWLVLAREVARFIEPANA